MSRLTAQKLLFRATLNRNTTLMLKSTTPRPTLHLATTPQPPVLHRRSRLLHNYVRCLVYYIDEIKYCPARNYYQLRFIFIAISTIMSPLLRPIHLTSEVFFCMCWKIAEIQDWLKNYKCMFLFFLSTFPPADDCMMWENISECYVQIIHLAKYINKNSNSCFTFQ
jgi:hypothetical protein